MKTIFYLIISNLLICVSFIFGQMKLTKFIPLKTNKIEVVKELGEGKGDCRCIYEVDKETIQIEYSSTTCEKGWNIPKNTIISITLIPKEHISLSDLNISRKDFYSFRYDNFFASYTSPQKGLRINVDSNETVTEYTRIPTSLEGNNTKIRCKGFSVYNPMNDSYIPFIKGVIDDWEESSQDITNIAENYRSYEKEKLYVFLYFSNKISTQKQQFWVKRIKKKFQDILKVKNKNVTVVIGGIRKDSEIEAFILPKHYPAPTANP